LQRRIKCSSLREKYHKRRIDRAPGGSIWLLSKELRFIAAQERRPVVMAKKLSVEEILAAARAEKAKGSATSPPVQEAATATEPPAAAAQPTAAPAETAAASPPPSAGKAAPGGKGMSMAEILAAARGKPGPTKAAPSLKPAEPKTAAPPKPAAEKAAPKPAAKPAAAKGAEAAAAPKDTASILAAARKGVKPGPMTKAEAEAKAKASPAAPPVKKKIEVPPMPAKPTYARPAAAAPVVDGTRRGFVGGAMAGLLFGSSLVIGFTSLAVTHLMWLLGLARFMFPNILIEPPTRFKVGFSDSLSLGQVETKFIPQFGVWIVRAEYEGQPMIFALKSVCTHLGCTPNWLEAEQKFKCPCHGSGFYKDGINFEGPAPRPLERYAISLAEDGQLLVDKSRTFQQELGQWKDAASFVTV
jgi:cytochrome b6-f complex iron-sulfur subunit